MTLMKRYSVIYFALALMGLGVLSVRADGFRNPPDTAAALGKSGKHIVWGDDASAIFYNPANLTEVASRQVQISSLLGYSHADYSDKLGQTTETESPWCVLPGFAIAWPLPKGSDLTLGFGVHVPFGRQTRWDADGVLRNRAPVFSSMSVMDFSPALAWRVSDSVSIGAGLDVYYGRMQLSLFPPPPPFGPGGLLTAEADGGAVGANVGITWRITPSQRLALTCRSPFDLKFSGEMKTTDIPGASPQSNVDTTFKYPTIVALGYGVRLTDTLRVEANTEWLQFSRFKTMAIDAGANNPLAVGLGLSNIPQNWNDTWTFGVGADWRFVPDWTLRAGYLYLQSPIPNQTFSPMALDVDQSIISIGLGYQTGRHTIDIAYALGLFNKRRIGDDNQNPGTYNFEGHLAALTYTYAF
jgi:long-chain fatty acid transport protein